MVPNRQYRYGLEECSIKHNCALTDSVAYIFRSCGINEDIAVVPKGQYR